MNINQYIKTMKTKKFCDKYGHLFDTNSEKAIFVNDVESVITESITEHERAQWKKYPDNKPGNSGEYLVEVKTSMGIQFELLIYDNGWWGRPDEMVIAFRELPEPYQEGREM